MLTDTLAHLKTLIPSIDIRVGPPQDSDWVSYADLWQSDGTVLAEMLGRLSAKYSLTHKHFLAASLLNHYSWIPITLGMASYYIDHTAPNLSPSNLLWRFNEEGIVTAIAVLDPQVTTLPDNDALRANLRVQFEQHMTEVVNTLWATNRIGKRALWSLLADRIAGLVLYVLHDQPDLCDTEVEAWVGQTSSPFRGKTGIIWLDHQPHPHPFLKRGACCLSYHVPEYGYCSTCPILPDEERMARLQAHLVESHS